MQRFLASLALLAVLLLAPIALHADTLMTGQFVITGTVQNVGTTLMFDPANLFTGTGTQTGTFATLLGDHQGFNGGTPNITYNPYTPDSAFFFIGPLTVTLDTLNETTVGSTLDFSGIANLAATGFLDTLANYSFNIPASGITTFTATAIVPTAPSVPEPSTISLLGTGALGLAGFAARKFHTVKA
jgi:hypothetical protein